MILLLQDAVKIPSETFRKTVLQMQALGLYGRQWELGGRMELDLTPVLMSKKDTLPHIISYRLQHLHIC